MDLDPLIAYVPLDRRQGLARGRSLPDRAEGAVLLADIAGFTPLTEALVADLGPRRGAEELIRLLNAVYEALIALVHRYGGSIVGFSGDGFLAWFDGDPGLGATTCALALQEAMTPFAAVSTPGATVTFALKVGVAAGPVRRFLVGDPAVQRLDLLAGATLDRLAQAEQIARQGEIVVGPEVARRLGDRLAVAARREGFAVAAGLTADAPPTPWPPLPSGALLPEQVRPFLPLPAYERLMSEQGGEFLAELRPAVALFLRFEGPDYDRDDGAGRKLDAYIRQVQAVLERYGGYLLQLTSGEKGNYLYASFGALVAHEDDAERAVAAALALRRPPPDSEGVGGVQIGISQGRVRAGAYGAPARRTYGAHGDEVNVAARLMQAAPPGEIRCSGRVYRAAGRRWAFEALPPVQLKGKAQPLPVYRPLARKQPQARGAMMGALVGRRAEMETLTRLLDEALAGQRRILLLEGEAGIGKSRLAAALARLAQQRGLVWLEGAGQSIEQQTPYRAWRDLLAPFLGLEGAQSTEERQRRVRAHLSAVDPALLERAPLLNDILRLGLPESDLTRSLDPQLRHESLTWLVIDLLRDALESGPLVLALEDAHWLDSLSWQLALAVGRALSQRPLLLALILRPLDKVSPPPAYTALRELVGVESLPLTVMPPAETVALAAASLGVTAEALPAEAADLVRERAGGNPFFAQELALALRDRGVLVVEGETCALTADLATLGQEAPGTVEGVVLSRIDRLPPEEQLTLKVAAVVGRSFLYRTVRDVHPRQVIADLLRAHLADLAHRDLTPLEALEPELTYLFKHIITQQVAYDTLLFAQRRELHRAVAGWYERAYAGDLGPYYPLLVHHWRRTEDVEEELRYCRLAGEQAAAQFANAEAIAYFSRALELTPETDLAARYDLVLEREKVYDLQGEREAQAQDLTALQGLAEALDDGRRQAEAALRRANHGEAIGDYPAAIAAAQAAASLAQSRGAVDLAGQAHLEWGRTLWRQGEYDTASVQLKRALGLAQGPELRRLKADALHNLGNVYLYQGDYARARDYYTQGLRLYRELGHRRGEGNALYNLGYVAHDLDEHDAAGSFYQQALDIYRQIGFRRGEASALTIQGILLKTQGNLTSARRRYERALRLFHDIGDRQGAASALANIGSILDALGAYAAAQPFFAQALDIHRELGERRGEGSSLANLSLVSHSLGDQQAAWDYARQASAIIEEIGNRSILGYTQTYLGHALVGLGACRKQPRSISKR